MSLLDLRKETREHLGVIQGLVPNHASPALLAGKRAKPVAI